MAKHILINASTVKLSGGLYISLDLIHGLIESGTVKVSIICPDIKAFKTFTDKSDICYVPNLLLSYFFRPLMDYFWLPQKIKQLNPDVVLSLSNLPAVTTYLQIFYHDNAYMTRSNFKGLNLSMRNYLIALLRKVIFKSRLQNIDRLIVQTGLERDLMVRRYSPTCEIKIVPPSIPGHLNRNTVVHKAPVENLQIGCLSRYYSHKNLELLFNTAMLARTSGINAEFVLTINKNQGRQARKLISLINTKNNQQIRNLGKIPRHRISEFIQKMDVIVLPSLCETFGLNSIEAWYHQKPFFVSDLPFAHEVCEDAAIYFNPREPKDLLAKIQDTINDKKRLRELINHGEKKLIRLPTISHGLRQIFEDILVW